VWCAEDDALLARIQDERLLHELWQVDGRGAEALHPRAAGLISALSDQAQSRELDQLATIAHEAPVEGMSPPLLHMLAIYQERVSDAVTRDGPRWIAAVLRSMVAWLALVDEARYLTSLGQAQYPDGGAAVALDVWRRPLNALGAMARGDARSLGERGQWAIRALSRMNEAARDRNTVLRQEVEKTAERLRTEAVEEALAVVADAIHEATARGAVERDGPTIAAQLARIWAWSDWDEHVERFCVDELMAIAWNVYQAEQGYAGLRALLRPVEPMIDSLARRLERDNSRIAYAAGVAQMMVFRSEMALSAPTRLSWAEEAVRICPTHRNGRLILARTLAAEVRDRLDTPFATQLDRKHMMRQVERARELYPRTGGLDDLQRRLEELPWWRTR
jgi:hypothetical protein